MRWSLVVADTDALDVPVGRSWQTMTPIHTGREEGGLVIYGGFDNNLTALGDCWRMDLNCQPCSWVRCPHLELGPRLWHAAVGLDNSQVGRGFHQLCFKLNSTKAFQVTFRSNARNCL